jgi:hypothetical protein
VPTFVPNPQLSRTSHMSMEALERLGNTYQAYRSGDRASDPASAVSDAVV